MLIHKEQRTLVKTRQRVVFEYRGKEQGRTFLVIGPASDGTWMIKQLSDPSWDTVDAEGQCHNYYYQGRTREVQELELEAYKQHQVQLSQGRLF
jgi:hypothetical protein